MKVYNFLVKRCAAVLAVMLALAVVCGVLMFGVGINSDLKKYLPDDSEMRRGMELMEEHFPDEDSYTIRVMFKDLVGDEKESVRETLSGINNVDSVEYDPDSSDFNKDGYTLFVLNTRFDYDSDEEAEIEENVASVFKDYDVTVRNLSLIHI